MLTKATYKSPNIDLFSEIKERVQIMDAFSYYGVKVNRHNKTCCPFHSEKTPSLVLYPDTKSFYCYGCNTGGSIIDFVSKMFGLSPLESAKKLDNDFGINLYGQELTAQDKAKYSEEKAKREKQEAIAEAFREWENSYYDYLCNNIQLYEKLLELVNPSKCNGKFTQEFADAINTLQILEYHWEILFYGTIDDKTSLYLELNRTVDK